MSRFSQLLPQDEFNLQLEANVHPRDGKILLQPAVTIWL